MTGLHFGPYGGQNDSDINNRFDWKTSDNAEAEVADHMGLHCFGGRAYGDSPSSNLSDIADLHPAPGISTSFVQHSPCILL